MPLNQMRLDLPHRVEHDTDDNQQARASEKLRRDHRHVQSLAEKAGQDRYQREKNCASERQPRHREIEKIGSWFARTNAWNVTAVFF